MILPCEYCGAAVDGEPFLRLGVGACCPACARIPFVAGVAGLLLFLALGAYVLVTF